VALIWTDKRGPHAPGISLPFPSFLEFSMLVESQVMETFKMTLGADHRDTLTSMGNLAFTWKDQGHHTAALALMEDCVQVCQRVLSPAHPHTLSSSAIVAKWSC
jgi:hypothetical protein